MMDIRFLPHNLHMEGLDVFTQQGPNFRALNRQKLVYKSALIDRLPQRIPGIYTITGGWQIGKTTLLKQWIAHLIENGHRPESITYFMGDDFVSQVSSMLHPGMIYRHIILTIPEQLREIFYNNRHNDNLLSALMRCGYECLEDVVSSIKRLSLKIGIIVVVQTHGRSGRFNPHLHIIMTNGGIHTDYIKAKGEVDIAYIDKKRIWPIEVKWTRQLRPKELKQMSKYPNSKILTKNRNRGEIQGIPTEPVPLNLFCLGYTTQ